MPKKLAAQEAALGTGKVVRLRGLLFRKVL